FRTSAPLRVGSSACLCRSTGGMPCISELRDLLFPRVPSTPCKQSRRRAPPIAARPSGACLAARAPVLPSCQALGGTVASTPARCSSQLPLHPQSERYLRLEGRPAGPACRAARERSLRRGCGRVLPFGHPTCKRPYVQSRVSIAAEAPRAALVCGRGCCG